jgi:hypothetical protein
MIHPVRWMVSGWLIWLMLICCERKTLLNDWLISTNKHKRTGMSTIFVNRYSPAIINYSSMVPVCMIRWSFCRPTIIISIREADQLDLAIIFS